MKKHLLRIPSKVPISYQSTDVLIAEAYKSGRVDLEGVKGLRPNPRSAIYVENMPDGTVRLSEDVVSTEEFIEMLESIDKFQIIF